jgi:tripartite-type tricarboxylate transporter receptor subunit TctC
VKVVLPVPPGSTTDILARLVADQLSETWSQPVIVQNMPGAAMNLGSEYVANADPDGYTLMICPPSPLSIQQLLYHDLKYDPTKFVPIAMLAKIPNVLAVRPDFPANSIAELLAYGNANPGKLTYASQGAGSTAHLSGGELEVLGGIKMVHVPYHGAQAALTDVMSSNVDMFFDTLTTSVPLYRAGKLKLLGVASAERASAVPEIPTIAESGLPGFRSTTWFAIVGPPGLPAVLAEKINRDVVDILRQPEIDEKLRALRLDPMGGTTADAAKFIADETKLWDRVITQAHITLQ